MVATVCINYLKKNFYMYESTNFWLFHKLIGPPTVVLYYNLLQAAQARIQQLQAETQRKEAEIHRLMAELQSQLPKAPVSQVSVAIT